MKARTPQAFTRVARVSGRIVDVVGRREFAGVVEIRGGRVARILPDRNPGRPGPLLLPGLVDAHIHIENSMLPPAEFARLAVIHGTVATVSDPHEIANVLGEAGVEYMIAEGRKTPFKFNFGAPSCVPATAEETAGAVIGRAGIERLLKRKDVRYLAEMMNFPGVLQRNPEVMAKIAAAKRRGKPVDGHAPGLRGADARRYAAAGIGTDHECFTLEEAKDKRRLGMKILIREGSAARNFDALAPLLKTDAEGCMFCCDDLHPDLLVRRHLDEHVRRALRLGADRFEVMRCASLAPVRHYGLDVGLLQPGDPADFIVVDGWRSFRVLRTCIGGRIVASGGRSRLPRRRAAVVNRFAARPRTPADFVVPAGSGKVRLIEALDGQLITRAGEARPTVRENRAVADPRRDLLKIAVINRYDPWMPAAVAFIRGFGLRRGAIASSVAHDSHNIVVVGASDEAMGAAVNAVIAVKGGISLVDRGRPRVLALPIAGLMSADDGRAVARRYTELDRRAKSMGSPLGAPFMTLAFMALLVIPDRKLSDLGLFSGSRWKFEERWAGEPPAR